MFSRLRTLFEAEHDRLMLFAPVLLAVGIITYFQLPAEPEAWPALVATPLLVLLTYAVWRKPLLRYVCLAALFMVGGFALAQWRTLSITPQNLQAPLNFAHVKAKVESIERTPKGSKLILRDVSIEELTPAATPRRISLTLRSYPEALSEGQIVALRAGLFPPPQPALPGGFDFARHYYFRGIGAVGYGMPPLTITPLDESGDSSMALAFSQWRHRITESIRSHFTEPAGSVAAAFITGQTAAIPEQVNDEMRIAGLYHLLAVSGLNLSIVAGIAFFSLRFLLAAIPAISLRYPIKKWAALLALLASYLYLQVAGSPVSAERAFLMVSLIFIAILLDRDPAPMRSVAASAFLILCVTPEAALSASFQLSFSATTALIASYEWGAARIRMQRGGFGLYTIGLYFIAVVATSLVAWLSTEPFIMYHFNQFSSYSLLANTIAEPLVSFFLMPLVVLGVLLMPLGLGALAFTPMQYGLDALLALTRSIAGLPHAMWIVPAPTDAGFALAVAGIIWLYLWKTRWRFLGLLFCIGGMCTAFSYTPPDMLISGDGRHIAVRLENGTAMIKGRKDSFIGGQWAHAMIEHALLDKKQAPVQCDKKGCILKTANRVIAIPKSMEALADDCAEADIVIATDFAVAEGTCPARLVIDKRSITESGAISLTFNGTETLLSKARSQQGARPWTGSLSSGDD